jgi:hypothetical protein
MSLVLTQLNVAKIISCRSDWVCFFALFDWGLGFMVAWDEGNN